MKKAEKVELAKSLSSELKQAKSAVFVNFAGLGVKPQQELKKRLREGGARMVVVKNTIIARSAESAGLPPESYSDTILSGQTALIISDKESITPVQILGKFAVEFEKPELKAGIIEGKFTDKVGLIKISKLPSREVLYSQVVGSMQSPMYGLVGILQGNLQKLVWILQQKAR